MPRCAFERCGDDFKPRRTSQIYCSSRCRSGQHNLEHRRQTSTSAGEVLKAALAWYSDTEAGMTWLKLKRLHDAIERHLNDPETQS